MSTSIIQTSLFDSDSDSESEELEISFDVPDEEWKNEFSNNNAVSKNYHGSHSSDYKFLNKQSCFNSQPCSSRMTDAELQLSNSTVDFQTKTCVNASWIDPCHRKPSSFSRCQCSCGVVDSGIQKSDSESEMQQRKCKESSSDVLIEESSDEDSGLVKSKAKPSKSQKEESSNSRKRKSGQTSSKSGNMKKDSKSGNSHKKLKKKEESSDDEVIQRRHQNRIAQQKRRSLLSSTEKFNEGLRAKKRMQKRRGKFSTNKLQSERMKNSRNMYLKRHSAGTKHNFTSDMDVFQYNFDCYQKSLGWYTCKLCHKRQLVTSMSMKPCKNCIRFSVDNDMDPFPLPEALCGLSFVEKQLIALIHPVVSLYKIRNCQYKYSGHVINFPQNCQEVADVLPHNIAELTSIITIRLDYSSGYKDFLVRRSKVTTALLWLKENNLFYKDISIDHSRCLNLPECSNVYQQLRGYNVEECITSEEDNVDHEMFQFDCKDDDSNSSGEFNFSYSLDSDSVSNHMFLHDALNSNETSLSEDDYITVTDVPYSSNFSHRDRIQNFADGGVVLWPTIGSAPINEFGSPGYIAMAFPHLFPYGLGDYSMPRKFKVKLSEYIQHLMMYEDGRFSKDERFRYFILNSQMRWNALNAGNVFVKKNRFFSKMSMIQLKDYLKEHPIVVKQILFYSSKIRSTRSYWNARCGELMDMAHLLGSPTVFFTLSNADFHWPDLYRLLDKDVSAVSTSEKVKLLSENPLLIDTFFVLRCKYFIDNCLKPKFNIKDIWYRFEYQQRGGIHCHGVAWFDNAPKISGPNISSSNEIISYFNNIVSCNNPDSKVTISETHPCQKRLSEVNDYQYDLAQLVNRIQRHTECKKNFCLRKKGSSNSYACRYKFPLPLQPETTVICNEKNVSEIIYARNDDRINRYNPWIIQTWRANMDISAIVDESAIYRYVAKYAAKSEIKSPEYSDIIKKVTSSGCSDNESCNKIIRKLLVSTCAERDYCAQEVMHCIMGYPFYHSSRDFVVVNLKQLDVQAIGKYKYNNSIFDNYVNRGTKLQYLCLYDYAKFYKRFKGKCIRRSNAAVVRLFPRVDFSSLKNFDESDVHSLFVFFVPWHSFDILTKPHIEKLHCINNIFLEISDILKKHEDVDNLSDESETEEQLPLNDQKDLLSSFNPNVNKMSIFNPGERLQDKSFKWDFWDYKYDKAIIDSVYSELLKNYHKQSLFDNVDFLQLNFRQKEVFQFCKSQAASIRKAQEVADKSCFVQGGAGTGKSFLLKSLYNFIVSKFDFESVVILAPTGFSAKNVNGLTIHSFLKFGRNFRSSSLLTGDDLIKFQESYNRLKFILVDEYSMIGCRMVALIDERFRQLTELNLPFGGLCIYFFGDCNQLIPIGDVPLFENSDIYRNDNGLVDRGKLLISMISKAFVLKESHRSANISFVQFLNRVSKGTCDVNDLHEMKKRYVSTMKRSELAMFKDAIRIGSTNESVTEQNFQCLSRSSTPIAKILAQNNCKAAFRSNDENCDGLVNTLYLSVGTKVMLRKNLNVSRGLVNGSIGFVVKILYSDGCSPPALPDYILVNFENVNMKGLSMDVTPIRSVISSWSQSGKSCSRIQLPLVLAWSCTIHKSQSLSFPKILLDLGHNEYSLGLIYVALSRVSDFSDIALFNSITLERLNCCKRSKFFIARSIFLKWLKSF